MNRFVLCSLFAMLIGSVSAQVANKIPRKLRGTYSGLQSEYTFRNHGNTVTIASVNLRITLEKRTVSLCFPSNGYCSISQTKAFTYRKENLKGVQRFIFQVNDDASVLKEEWELDVKKRQLIRVGIAPQPNTILTKSRKKQ